MSPSLQSPTKTIPTDAHRRDKAKKYRGKAEKNKEKARRKDRFLPNIDQRYLTSSQCEERIIQSRSMRPSKTRVRVILRLY